MLAVCCLRHFAFSNRIRKFCVKTEELPCEVLAVTKITLRGAYVKKIGRNSPFQPQKKKVVKCF